MLVEGKDYRTIWLNDIDHGIVNIIDQRFLPHQFIVEELKSVGDIIIAIKDMHVRGAGLIGVTAGFGMYFAALEACNKVDFRKSLTQMANELIISRPTAVNLEWAVKRQLEAISIGSTINEKINISKLTAQQIADEDATNCKSIGLNGVGLIEKISRKKNGETVNILTHCNAGWLAFTDYGTATSPIYEAFDRGIDVHVWVDETRPRNQGANLTAWELLNHGVPHTIVVDNTGGHLMQNNKVDMVITGADRVTQTGDVANKIGTYLKALAAKDNHIPFYVAIPSSTIDWSLKDGNKQILIEERSEDEIKYILGMHEKEMKKVLIAPEKSPAVNYGFDITPSRLITGLITERGICKASESGIIGLFPEKNMLDGR